MLRQITKRFFATSFRDPVLEKMGFQNHYVLRNLSVAELYEFGISKHEPADPSTPSSMINNTGAYCAYSGLRTGRSPQDKRIVFDDKTKLDVWWGDVNIPIPPESNKLLEEMAIAYLNTKKRVFITDGYLGWDPRYRLKCRVLTTRSYHALFMRNMLVVPSDEELKEDFVANKIDIHVLNAGEFMAPVSPLIKGLGSDGCCVSLNLSKNRMTILGTQFAGEMKKGLFSMLHYHMPKKGVLSLHASANEGPGGDCTLLFGLSGTGKSTLAADPSRRLIGDDEHCWTHDGIFNVEGGCYAKCIGLTEEKEPEIFRAVKFGAVLENVAFYDQHTREVNFHDLTITENTRVSFPLEFIPTANIPAIGQHPHNMIFLTCDAFGVFPPVSKLTPEQAMYHFISGYTAKVAGTEVGVKEPVPTFSTCFGAAFLSLHPTVYAEMMFKKMKKHHTTAWLINTGWAGGKYGIGKRMDLQVTRKIIDAIHKGKLGRISTKATKVFRLHVPVSCPGVDSKILNPQTDWHDKNEYYETVKYLANAFDENFKAYKDKASKETIHAGPKIPKN